MSTRKPVMNIEDVAFECFKHGEKFAARHGRIGPVIGAEQLGCAYTIVPPGKRAFPHHNHHVNEEMMVIMEGEGEYRFGKDRYPVRPGDVVAAPTGGPERAHQLINTGERDLKYLCVSTMAKTEVVEYPDSGKIGALTYANSDDDEPVYRHRAHQTTPVDFLDGEE